MAASLSWGIIGAGSIARKFAGDLPASRTGSLLAVGSRSAEKAKAFAAEMKAPRAYGSYEELLADGDVQAVYVATPHPHHAQWAIKAADAGKHLLVEKPLAMNSAEVEAIVEAAVRNDVFLMEAFMYRCHSQTRRIVELIREGAIGDVRVIQASFGFHASFNPESRLLDAQMGGGGIMDVGCYAISMARLIAGAAHGTEFEDPASVLGAGHVGTTGVDEWAAGTLTFSGGIIAQVSTAVQANLENVVRVFGSSGSLFIPSPWGASGSGGTSKLVLKAKGETKEIVIEESRPIYAVEADTVAENLEKRQAASPAMTVEDSLGQARAVDSWRKAVGVVYPNERDDTFPPHVLRRPLKKPEQPVIPSGRIEGIDKPVSRLVLGAYGEANYAAVLFDTFFEAGGTCFDTSYVYGQGRTDKVLGRWVNSRGVRDDVVLLAKGAHTPFCNPKDLTSQLLASLEFLQTDYADLYIMHRDNLDIPVGEFVDVLNEHVCAGRIRVFGGSNWTLARLKEANEYAAQKGLQGFGAVSNNFSLARMVNPVWDGCIAATDAPFKEWLAATKTPLMAWSSQARGFFVRGRRDDESDSGMVRPWYSDDNFERLARATTLAEKMGVTANNIALAYVLSQPFPAYCLIGPQKLSELRTSLPALRVKLTSEQMSWLNLESDTPGA